MPAGKPRHPARDDANTRPDRKGPKDQQSRARHGKEGHGKDEHGKDSQSKSPGTGVLSLPGGGKHAKPQGGRGKPRGARPGSSGPRRDGQQRRTDGGMRPLRRRRSG